MIRSWISLPGMKPIPHIAARDIQDMADLEMRIETLAAATGGGECLVIAGSGSKPVGCFSDSMQVSKAQACTLFPLSLSQSRRLCYFCSLFLSLLVKSDNFFKYIYVWMLSFFPSLSLSSLPGTAALQIRPLQVSLKMQTCVLYCFASSPFISLLCYLAPGDPDWSPAKARLQQSRCSRASRGRVGHRRLYTRSCFAVEK